MIKITEKKLKCLIKPHHGKPQQGAFQDLDEGLWI